MRQLEDSLQRIGAHADVNILRSDAGLMTTTEAARNPIYGVLSGPSGGVAGALYIARRAGYENILTFDMGGTSTDVALCQNGEPTIVRDTSIGHFRVKVPSVNVHTVGAGGGSIAHVPQLTRALRVGPQSAGAEPGPAAYGKGGTDPTVTDANVVLGHLPPRLLGGEMALDVEAARDGGADDRRRHRPGASRRRPRASSPSSTRTWPAPCAWSRCSAATTRATSPSWPSAAPGPLHANAVAQLMGSFPVIVPPSPGLLCAVGDLVAEFRNEFAQTHIRLVEEASGSDVADILDDLGGRAQTWMLDEGIEEGDQRITYVADMRYHLQGYEIPVGDRARRRARATGSASSRSASTPCTSSSTGSACRTSRRRS